MKHLILKTLGLIFFIVVLVCIFNPYLFQSLQKRFCYRYHNIASQSQIILSQDHNDLKNFSDENPLTIKGLKVLPPTGTADLVFDFGRPRSISKVSIFFWGDLHRAMSYHATEYKIDFLYRDKWVRIIENKHHRGPWAAHHITAIEAKQIRFIFSKPFLDEHIYIAEIGLYEAEKVPLWTGLTSFLKLHCKSLPACFFYILIFLCFLFFPGYCFTKYVFKKNLDKESMFVFSFFFSFFIYSALSIFGLLTGQNWIYYLILPISIAAILIFICKGGLKEIRGLDKNLWMILILFLFFSTLYQYHRDLVFSLPYIESHLDTLTIPPLPYYGYHADNFVQWRISKAFLHHLDLTSPYMKEYLGDSQFSVFHRTPLLPILSVPFLSFFGESHFIYQRLLTILAGLFLLPLYLVLKKDFNKRTAQLTLYTLLINFFFFLFSFSFEMYYKYFALFPVFLFLLLIEQNNLQNKKVFILCALVAGTAYLIHPGIGLVYLSSLYIYALLKFRSWRWLFLNIGGFLLIITPWLLFLLYYHHQLSFPWIKGPYATIVSDWNLPRPSFLMRLIAIFIPVIQSHGMFPKNLSLWMAISPLIFIIFIAACIKRFLTYKKFILLSFLPCLILTLPKSFELFTFGYFFLIPMALAFSFFEISSIKRPGLQKIIFYMILTQYIIFNLIIGKKVGSFFYKQIQWSSITLVHAFTFIGMAIYILTIVWLLFRIACEVPSDLAIKKKYENMD